MHCLLSCVRGSVSPQKTRVRMSSRNLDRPRRVAAVGTESPCPPKGQSGSPGDSAGNIESGGNCLHPHNKSTTELQARATRRLWHSTEASETQTPGMTGPRGPAHGRRLERWGRQQSSSGHWAAGGSGWSLAEETRDQSSVVTRSVGAYGRRQVSLFLPPFLSLSK